MVELDAPGHAAPSWCKSGYDVCPPSPGCWHLLNFASNSTYAVLDDLLEDLTDVFPDTMIHLGGDECGGVDACAQRIPSIAAFLKKHGLTNGTDGYLYFVQRYQGLARNKGRVAVGWEDIWKEFGTRLDRSTVVHQVRLDHRRLPILQVRSYGP
jgi:hexosaminidase